MNVTVHYVSTVNVDDVGKIYSVPRGLDTKWSEFYNSTLTKAKFGKVVLVLFSVESTP